MEATSLLLHLLPVSFNFYFFSAPDFFSSNLVCISFYYIINKIINQKILTWSALIDLVQKEIFRIYNKPYSCLFGPMEPSCSYLLSSGLWMRSLILCTIKVSLLLSVVFSIIQGIMVNILTKSRWNLTETC